MTFQIKPTPWRKLFSLGYRYMKSWPLEKRLAILFPENRVIYLTRFAIRYMPPIAAFTLCWQIALGGDIAIAIATACFACSFPMQGLVWLGRRSRTVLSLPLSTWLNELNEKLNEAGKQTLLIEQPATYQDLANVLHQALECLDKTFLDDI